MAETRAQGDLTSPNENGSDTSADSRALVFGKDLPDNDSSSGAPSGGEVGRDAHAEPKSSAKLQAEIDAARARLDDVADELEARVEDKVETVRRAKRALDPRRLLKAYPIAAAAIGVAAVAVGFVAYRAVRTSLPVRLYLALRLLRG